MGGNVDVPVGAGIPRPIGGDHHLVERRIIGDDLGVAAGESLERAADLRLQTRREHHRPLRAPDLGSQEEPGGAVEDRFGHRLIGEQGLGLAVACGDLLVDDVLPGRVLDHDGAGGAALADQVHLRQRRVAGEKLAPSRAAAGEQAPLAFLLVIFRMGEHLAARRNHPVVALVAAVGRQMGRAGLQIDLIEIRIAMVGVDVRAFAGQRDPAEVAEPATGLLADAIGAEHEARDLRRLVEYHKRLQGFEVQDLHPSELVLVSPVHAEVDRRRARDDQEVVAGPGDIPELEVAWVDGGQELAAHLLHRDAPAGRGVHQEGGAFTRRRETELRHRRRPAIGLQRRRLGTSGRGSESRSPGHN